MRKKAMCNPSISLLLRDVQFRDDAPHITEEIIPLVCLWTRVLCMAIQDAFDPETIKVKNRSVKGYVVRDNPNYVPISYFSTPEARMLINLVRYYKIMHYVYQFGKKTAKMTKDKNKKQLFNEIMKIIEGEK